jgi:predicted SAM-dependent methyltransferase
MEDALIIDGGMRKPAVSVSRRLLLALFGHRTLALLRWDLQLLQVRIRNVLLRKETELQHRIASSAGPLYMNLGSGPRGLRDDCWINVDGYSDVNVDYMMDFTRKWPFPENSLDGIFCEHVFEHFDYNEGQQLLKQSLRALRPGGTLRIIVPDGRKILETYCRNPKELLVHRDVETRTPMDAVNSWFRQRYEHQFTYDFETLQEQLKRAGFQDVAEVSFKVGRSKPLILDDEKYEWESLYVEATKPANVK